MRANLQRILELQVQHQARISPAMDERGQLVRHAAPNWLRERETQIGAAIGVEDFFVEGGDGTGLKNRVPWVRFGSRSQSRRATEGFYVVYLFDALGGAVYLSLNQGTTDSAGGDFAPKPPGVIEGRVNWAREVLADWLPRVGAPSAVSLNDPNLGAGYERANVIARAYRLGNIPDEDTLIADARLFAEGLGRLYAARAKRPIPNERPEVVEAEEAAAEASGRTRSKSSAGFRTNAAEIKLIELHAIALARAYYEADGWSVKELGKPFDLEVRKKGEKLDVEVKGTSSDGAGVPLTAGEVRHQKSAYPNNALVVVRGITLDRSVVPPAVSNGILYELRRWEIGTDDLRAISYSYEVPAQLYEREGTPCGALLTQFGRR